jgi:hypothetical protein
VDDGGDDFAQFVAMPTAMPDDPLTTRFGMPAGRTDGSSRLSSKFGA